MKNKNLNVKVKNRLKRVISKANNLGLIKSHVLAYEEFPVEKEIHKGKVL